jgi:hypothetical protein
VRELVRELETEECLYPAKFLEHADQTQGLALVLDM